MSENTKKKSRYLKNYLIDPVFQLKYAFYFISFAMAIWGGSFALGLLKFNEFRLWLVTNNYSSPEVIAQTNVLVTDMTVLAISSIAMFCILGTGFAILATHRVVGPKYAILITLEEMKKGNYDVKRKLRKFDELTPIMDGLIELSEKLKNKP